MTPKQILKKALSLIENEDEFIQGHLWNNDKTKFCAIGAETYAISVLLDTAPSNIHAKNVIIQKTGDLLLDATEKVTGKRDLPQANDGPPKAEAHQQIKKIFQTAIEAC